HLVLSADQMRELRAAGSIRYHTSIVRRSPRSRAPRQKGSPMAADLQTEASEPPRSPGYYHSRGVLWLRTEDGRDLWIGEGPPALVYLLGELATHTKALSSLLESNSLLM